MRKIILGLIISFLITSQSFAQTFTAKANRPEVSTNEVFAVTFTYDGKKPSKNPDFSEIEKNFKIFGTEITSETGFANGYVTTSTSWQVTMSSNKESGEITIPSISVDNIKSNPVTIRINNDAPKNAPVESQKDKFEYNVYTQTDVENPIIGQQIEYNIIVEENSNLEYSSISFDEKSIEDWDIVELSNPSVSEVDVDGKPMRQVKFSYAIFPQKSGEIELPSTQIVAYKTIESNGLIKDLRNSRFAFLQNDQDFVNRMLGLVGQRISTTITTKPKKINISPAINNSQSSWWLPAKNVEINSKWDTDLSDLKVGQPVRRTIDITATGVTDVQIPNLELNNIEDLKVYPEKPSFSASIKDGNIVSSSTTSVIYIKTKSGEIKIPEEVIYWYDTKTKQMRKAVLSSQTLYFKGMDNTPIKEAISENTIEKQVESIKEKADSNSIWLIIGAFLGGMLLTYIIIRPKKHHKTKKAEVKKLPPQDVVKVTKSKDLKAVQEALISWSKERFKDKHILNLDDVKKHIKNENMQAEIDNLSKAIYAKDEGSFNKENFIKAFKEIEKNGFHKTEEKEILPKLYK